MTNERVAPRRFSDAQHPYSHVRAANGFLFISGQLGVRDNEIVPGGIEAEARQALANLAQRLTDHGCGASNVVKTTVLLADLADRIAFDEIYSDFFGEPRPARTCYAAGALPYGARVEIEAIAAESLG